uniref:E3 ubiquitin-protein ligase listerin n=1 Tax=Saccoglossus kowalevskii TaxID=10224 RepID=A0ABM0MZ86_SACKO|nr:PREDICTED: E3 ubiquitin-protein ligase listerin-like [Saccoglossus kowalevskii]
MGGKKKAQRTKGNTRPSSSGRSADLLTKDGRVSTGFVGFGALSGDLGYVPLQGVEDIDTSVDSDFRMVMRKITKKDVTTKLKAIQEFTSLCKDKDEDSVKGTLPYWRRLYSRTCMDYDRRVREALQQAHEQLALKVRRSLAPHLKSIMGPWLLSQCDTYAPAASAAKSAFNSAFPLSKQSEAILFCKEDILMYIQDNLFKQTAATLSDPKSTPAEEMETKYNRVITSSFLALNYFLLSIPKKEHENLVEIYRTLFEEPKFWKYSKSKTPMIRGAFYSTISALCQVVPEMTNKYSVKLTPSVLGNLDDTDPVVCQPLWEAVLYVVSIITECWQHINVRKALLPKLWSVFRQGGNGSASVVYPNFLPLLSKIPSEIISQNVQFYQEWFGNMKTGLTVERVLMSSSECSAIIVAYMECLRLSLQKHLQDTAENRLIQNYLILDQLMPMIETSIVEEKTQQSSSSLYVQICDLVNYLEKESDKETNLRLLELFWENLTCICVKYVNDDSIARQLENMALLLECIKSPDIARKMTLKKSVKVKFSEDAVNTGARRKTMPTDEEEPKMVVVDDVKSEGITQASLLDLVCKVTSISLQVIQSTQSLVHQRFLARLVKRFADAKLFNSLVTKRTDILSDESELKQDIDKTYTSKFFHMILLPWIDEVENHRGMYSVDCIVDLVLTVIKSCHDEAEKTSILNEATTDWCDPDITRWLKGPEFGKKLIQVAVQLCHNSLTSDTSESSNDSSWMIISLGLSTNQNLDIVSDKLKQTWKAGTKSLICQFGALLKDDGFLCRAVSWIKQTLMTCTTCKSANHLAESAVQLCHIVISSLPSEVDVDDSKDSSNNHIILTLWDILLPSSDEWNEHRTHLPNNWKATLAMKRIITVADIPESFTSSCSSTPKYILLSIFSSVMFKKCCHSNRMMMDLDSESISNVLDIGDFLPSVLECVYGLKWCHSVLGLPAFKSPYPQVVTGYLSDVEVSWEILSSNLEEIFHNYQAGHWELLLALTFERSLQNGYLWSQCTSYIISSCIQNNIFQFDVIQCAGTLDRFAILDDGSLHTLQSVIPYITSEEVLQLIEINVAKLLTCTESENTVLSSGTGALSIINKCLHHSTTITSDLLISALDQLASLKDEIDELFLFSCNMNEITSSKMNFNIEAAELMISVVKRKPDVFVTKHWDFFMCSLVSWIQSCAESLRNEPTILCQVFSCSVLDLLSAVSDYIQSGTHTLNTSQISEWHEFFSDNAYTTLFPLFIHIIDCLSSKDECELDDEVIQSLCVAMTGITSQQMKESKITMKLRVDISHHLPDEIQSLLNHLCPLMILKRKDVQVTACQLLLKLIPELPKLDESLLLEIEDKDEIVLFPTGAVMEVLNATSDYLDDFLSPVRVGDCVFIEAYSDQYHYTFAYLSSWNLLLAFFKSAKAELRAGYAAYLRKHKMVDSLLSNLFRLMPMVPVVSTDAAVTKTSMFNSLPQLNIKGKCPETEIHHLACAVYQSALEDLPAMVRQWWNSQDKRVAAHVDGFTTKYVTPSLVSQEIQSIQNSEQTLENLTVKGRPITREIIATYTMDLSEEVSIELVIQLPPNYPLGKVVVDSGKKIGVSTSQWRNWMLQLTTFLVHQNGSVMDGLTLWKRNVDKRFEGLEDCMICFSVIHGSSYSLPRLTCRTCKKKYHSECLYKWFSTSNQSTCPLCRNLF